MTPEYISTSQDYLNFFEEGFNDLPDCVRSRLAHDETLRHMRFQMLTFKPEFSREILEGCYSTKTGRRGMDPVLIVRSFLLMISYGCHSITRWVKKVKTDIALQFLLGQWKIPPVGSHYDFMYRILGIDPQ